MYCVKKNLLFFFCVYTFVILTEGAPRKWPSKFPNCYRDDPNLNKCMLDATVKMAPFLKEGVPELQIVPISPYIIPEITVQQHEGWSNYTATFTNVEIIGLDTYKFDKFDFDVKKLIYDASLSLGAIKIKGHYVIKGKLFNVPVDGNGGFNGSITNANGTIKQQTKLVTKKDIDYLEAGKSDINFDFGDITDYHLDGLINGNELLSQAPQKAIKDNLKDLIDEVKPTIKEVVEKLASDILSKGISRYPYDQVFPVHT